MRLSPGTLRDPKFNDLPTAEPPFFLGPQDCTMSLEMMANAEKSMHADLYIDLCVGWNMKQMNFLAIPGEMTWK